MRVGRWPFLALLVLCLLAVLYRVGPCRSSAKWRWVSVGSVFATTVWLLPSAAFSLYVSYFANYDKTYGSLGAVIILLLWLYISFYIILLGAEINAELELQTAVDTTTGRPKPMGKRGAFVADHLLAGLKVTGDHRALSRAIPRQQNLARRSKCGSKTVLIGGCSAAFRVRCHFYDYRLGASFS